MASVEQLKDALLEAHREGDTEAAQLFASKIKEKRKKQSQPTYKTDDGQTATNIDRGPLGAVTSFFPGSFEYLAESAAKGASDIMQSLGSLPFDVAGAAGVEGAEDVGRKIRQGIPEVTGGQGGTEAVGTLLQYGVPGTAGFKLGRSALSGAGSFGRYAGGLLGAAAAETAVTDPEETNTVGNLLGYGPTQLTPGDTALSRRLKTGAETIPLGMLADTTLIPFRAGANMEKKLARNMRERVQEFADDPGIDEARTPDQLADEIEAGALRAEGPEQAGFRPTTGTLSDHDLLVSLEQGGSSSPRMMTRFRENRKALNRAALDAVEATGDPEAARRFFLREYEGPTREAQAALNDVEARLSEAENELGIVLDVQRSTAGRAEAERASQELDKVTRAELAAKTAKKNQNFDEIDPNNEVPLPAPQKLRDRLNQRDTLRSKGRTDTSVKKLRGYLDTPVLRQLVRILRTPDSQGRPAVQGTVTKPLTIGEINDLRPDLSAAIRRARETDEGSVVNRLVNIKRALDEQYELLAESGQGETARQAAEAVRYYKKEFAPQFKEYIGGRYRRNVRRDTALPSQTAQTFLMAPKEGVEQLRRILNDAPDQQAGMQAAEDFLSSQLANALQSVGRTSSGKVVDRFINRYSTVFEKFPELRQRFSRVRSELQSGSDRVSGLTRSVKKKQGDLKKTEQEQARSAARFFLDTEDPATAVSKALNSDNPARTMGELRRRALQAPEALKGLRAATQEAMRRIVTNPSAPEEDMAATVARFNKTFNNPKIRRGLKQVYTPSEMRNLNAVRARLNEMARINRRVTDNSITRQLQESGAQRTRIILSSLYGIVQGQGIFQIGKWMGQIARGGKTIEEIASQLIEDAMLDPKLAATLLRGNTTKTKRQLRTYLANNYPEMVSEQSDDQSE